MTVLLAIALLASPAQPAVRDRIALTLSGGVSLGSYEAGLTWAIVRYLRSSDRGAELAATTGASAGGINALMAAVMWCEERGESRDDHPDTNLFLDLWAPVGLEDLLPEDPSAFTPRDGLLSAAPLERAFRRLRTEIFSSGVRFRPGCAVSVGFTVTRDPPEQRTLAGLRSRRQRFVIPLRFEIDRAGRPGLIPAPLPSDRDSADSQLLLGQPPGEAGIGALQAAQAALASGAFPLAFHPRELCDCALRCPGDQLVTDGVCEGPDYGQQIPSLSCDAVSPAGSRQLCRRNYIDGGIFDNAPIGLTVDLAESSGAMAVPFAPTVYLFVDPDHRRLSPMDADGAKSGLAAPAQTIVNLIGTARESELTRASRDERWQRSTQSTLSDLAEIQSEVAAIQDEMARVAGASGGAGERVTDELLRSPRREMLGSFLLRCLGEVRRAVNQADDVAPEQLDRCAEALRDGTAASADGGGRPSPEEIADLASALAAVVEYAERRADQIVGELTSSSTPFDRQLRLLAFAQDSAIIATTTSRFLIGEIPSIARSGLTRAQLVRLRRDLLVVGRFASRGVRLTSAMLRVFLLATLLEEEAVGVLPRTAADAAHAALSSGLEMGLQDPALKQMGAVSERVAGLMALAPRLRTLSARADNVAADAAQLSATNAPERLLVLSRRFSPLGGGALLNFSGFLDRPLRDLDFYSGIYDAAVQIATHECEIQGPYPSGGRPAPAFRDDAPLTVDASSEETQRCLGDALREVVDTLQLRRSARAMFVVAALTRLEVGAEMGSRSAADRLLAEPAFRWLDQPVLSAGDPLGPALAAVTSRKAPCHELAEEALCLVDPDLDELLDGLRRSGYEAASPSMRDALSNGDRWSANLTRKLMDRAAAVAVSSPDPGARSGVLLTGMGLGELWARRAHTLTDAPALDLDPSSIPGRPAAGGNVASLVVAHVLPYRVSLDVVRGGAGLSWIEPALRISSSFSIESVADLVTIEGSGRLATTVGLVPTFRARGIAIGAGAQSVLPWNGDPLLAPGAFGRIAFLQERLAVTAGVRSLSPERRDPLVSISVSDLNGVAYWLALWSAGRR